MFFTFSHYKKKEQYIKNLSVLNEIVILWSEKIKNMKIVDTKGLSCPRPLIMLKEALLEIEPGDQIQVITDNETSLKNLITYLKDQGANPTVDTDGNVHTITSLRPDAAISESNPAAYCTTVVAISDYVVCLKSTLMGNGDPDLGKLLMETFVENLKLQDHLPSHVVLYNEGVKLAMKESPVCSSLCELEELGCRIMLCGTCIDHFSIQYEIGVGMISNMVSITETLVQTGHVVTP
jgi:selenium metabolism protein YedF